MEEVWKQIKGNKNYEVSNLGRVRNIKTGRILKHSIDKEGNSIVTLYSKSKKNVNKIHRLVFGNHTEHDLTNEYVRHIDGDKQNNELNNLELKHKRKKILVVETGETFNSIAECSEALGMSISTISKCCNYSFYNNQYNYHFKEID